MLLRALALLQATVVSPSGPYRTLDAAIAATPAHGVVEVRPGVYREPTITIRRPITVAGDSGAVLDGGGTHAIMVIAADSVTVRGLEFRNTGMAFREDRAALRLEHVQGAVVEENHFLDTFFAVYIAASHDCMIRNNVIAGRPGREIAMGDGVHLWASRRISVVGNSIRGHRDGIYLEFSHDADVRDNVDEGNVRYGMHFMYSDSSVYTHNTFRDNGSGVAVMYTRSVAMIRNHFSSNHGTAAYGLLLKEVQDAVLTENVFSDNTIGLMADGADRMMVEGNRFTGNGWGLRLLASTGDGRIVGNAFRRNTFDLVVNGDGTNADVDGNWWDSYHGWDLDHDGVGDVAYHPMRLFGVLIEQAPAALLLQRALFVRVLDAAEHVLPVLTPANVVDHDPLMADPTARFAVSDSGNMQ